MTHRSSFASCVALVVPVFAGAIGAAGAVGGAASQPFVIYDSLWIHDNGVMNAGVGNAIGGSVAFPSLGTVDIQIAEDFVLDRPATLSVGVIDIMTHDGTVPAEGIWVQVYPDAGGKPAEDVAFDWVATEEFFEVEEIFSPLEFRAWRITIDLTPAGIELDEGAWWVNFQPLDIETHGDWFWSIGAVGIDPIGFPSHVRDGWLAHGNRYRGLWNSTVWIPHNFRGNAVLSWRLEGLGGGGDCTGREKLKVKCPSKGCGLQVMAKLKKGSPGATLRFLLDGANEQLAVVNDRGQTKVRWCPVSPLPHDVDVVECGLHGVANCR